MKRLDRIFAVLAFAFALLMGAAGGAMAHVEAHAGIPAAPMDHHGSHHAPSQGNSHSHDSHSPKAALVVVAPCCPAAEAPASHAVTVTVTTVETPWHPQPEYVPGARDIAPEPPPPKTSL